MSAEEEATVREPLDLIRLSMEERIYGFIITTRHCSPLLLLQMPPRLKLSRSWLWFI
uniref:Uncharacterized protein n=1 Tax=Brassica oleracea TaxID=3712 RepID=A0A3P6CVY3_BRAOL|nr:unnamed protein product [Brassica oleracea]